MLYLIGLGLNDEKDISVKGLEAVKRCSKIYLESYTSMLNCKAEDLEKAYGKKVILANRDLVEKRAEETILKDAKESDAVLLVIGDVFSATTHTDIMLRAKKAGIKVEVVHNASVLTAAGITGLELYKFGRVASIPFHNENVKSPVEALQKNQSIGLHTLFLLDLDLENKKCLTIKDAAEYLMRNGVKDYMMAVGCAALGSTEPEIRYAALKQMKDIKFKKFPQCLIIPSKLHFMEEEALQQYRTK